MEQPSRRAVLRGVVVVAASAAIPAALASPAEALGRPPAVTRLRRRVFRPYVRTAFYLTGGGRTYRAVLARVADDPDRPGETRFSLVFRAPGRPADGIYTVTHPRLKAFQLYVGGIGAPGTGWYEAVVNS